MLSFSVTHCECDSLQLGAVEEKQSPFPSQKQCLLLRGGPFKPDLFICVEFVPSKRNVGI